MADCHRVAHRLYLDMYDLRQHAQRKLRNQGVYLSDVALFNRLLRMVVYGHITIVNEHE